MPSTEPQRRICAVFRSSSSVEKYGIIEGVSDREYVSNSFHCHVTEDITPIQNRTENRFWDLSNGGKIQYVKYPIDYNTEAIKTLIHRAMDMGFYEVSICLWLTAMTVAIRNLKWMYVLSAAAGI